MKILYFHNRETSEIILIPDEDYRQLRPDSLVNIGLNPKKCNLIFSRACTPFEEQCYEGRKRITSHPYKDWDCLINDDVRLGVPDEDVNSLIQILWPAGQKTKPEYSGSGILHTYPQE